MSNMTETFGGKILTAEKVSKIYGKGVEALKNLSMEIPQGSIYGLLGPNGAGKSTLLRLWVGLLRPTQGTVQVWGQEPRQLPVEQRQHIGYASETMTLPDWMKVHELIGFNKSFYPAWDDAFCQEMIHHFKLPLDRNVKALSRGEQRKLVLLLSLGHKPDLLILDEPFGGLDAAIRQELIESLVQLMTYAGKTMVITSHLLTDLERFIDRIGLLMNGTLRFSKPIEQVKQEVKQVRLAFSDRLPEGFSFPGALRIQREAKMALVTMEDWSEEKIELLRKKYPNASVEVFDLGLEQIFVEYIKEDRHE